MQPSALARKLVVKPGDQLLAIQAPAGYLEALTPLPEGATATESLGEGFEVVQLFATDMRKLQDGLQAAIRAVKPGGVLWVSYPKLTSNNASDLSRDRVREAVGQSGWDTVSQVAIDETWSALRLKPAGEVKHRTR